MHSACALHMNRFCGAEFAVLEYLLRSDQTRVVWSERIACGESVSEFAQLREYCACILLETSVLKTSVLDLSSCREIAHCGTVSQVKSSVSFVSDL
ncbi:hypothetical protein Tco_1313168 [Tanacetum coccineum]